MSPLTRIGLLIGWFPLAIFINWIVLDRFHFCDELLIDDYNGELPIRCTILLQLGRASFWVFVTGLIVLASAGGRHAWKRKSRPV